MTGDLLKKTLLQWAVQGNLVPQDPADEPALCLVQRIEAEKKRLVKEGKIKKEKHTSTIFKRGEEWIERIDGRDHTITKDIPFEIPSSWTWVRLGSLGEIVGGGTPKTSDAESWKDGTIPWLTPADMKHVKGKFVACGERNITQHGLDSSSARLMPKGSLVYSSRAPIGYIAIAENPLCTNQGFKSLVPICFEVCDYIYYALIAFTPTIQARASGTTFKEISGTELAKTLLPLPPLSEQKRIVAKLEALEPLVARFGELNAQLTKLDAGFKGVFKKSVLQWAVQGKLVPQSPEDEPVEALLKRIEEEKKRLVKEGKLKKEKPLPPVVQEEIPFEIPASWTWVRLGTLIRLQSGQDLIPSQYNADGKGIPYITGASNFDNGDLVINRWTEYGKSFAFLGDLLLTCKGTIGEMAILQQDRVHIARQVMAIHPIGATSISYVRVFLSTLVEKLESVARSMIPGIGRDDVLESLMPLPPLVEQERIVAKLEEVLGQLEK